MAEYKFKISGAHYAANPDSVAGKADTEEMHARTRELLSWVRDEQPIVVLSAEPTNHHNPDAVMARALGRRIGYVGDEYVQVAKSLLAQTDDAMLLATIAEVLVDKHGCLWVVVEADELTQMQPLAAMDIEWGMWLSDLPLLPLSEDWQAEKEAACVLDRVLLPKLDEVDITKLKIYLDIWLRGSRHDLSREARQKRSAYIERLMTAQSKEKRQLAEPLKRQRTSICGRTLLNERTGEWWKGMMETDDVQRLWNQWWLKSEGHLWSGLRQIDAMLRQLPGALYEDLSKLDEMLSRLYYMNTPRKALQAILALLMLRQLTCRELGIKMRPMTEDDYQQDGVITNPMEMPTTIGRVLVFGETQCELPMQRQTIQLLAHWLRDDYEQSHSKEIEALAVDKQGKRLAEAIEKAATKPTTIIPSVGNYKPQIQTQNVGLPTLPTGPQDTKQLGDE